MDFDDTIDEAAYRATARAWLDENAAAHRAQSHADDLTASKAWQKRKAEAGYAQITWPKDWGGPGGTPIQSVIFGQEEARTGIAARQFTIGLGMCVPTVMKFADDATKERFAGPALRGEEIWSQLFSEPAGGSDVAAIRTRAVREGDDWVVNGQKVWTSGAHYSDYGIVLVRTDPDVAKHKGLTMFWLDLGSPGIDIRPIHQMSGGSDFNEVWFTDVRIADAQRLGPVDGGWNVALFTLMNERLAIGGGGGGVGPAELLELARTLPGADDEGGELIRDAGFRQRFADWYVAAEGLKNTRLRTITALSRGQTPGPESAIGKIISANQMQDLGNAAIEAEDQFGIIADGTVAPMRAAFQQLVMTAPGYRIAGGTDEILKNIIAERVLGLPGEIRTDKDAAFKDLPVGR